MTTNSSEKLLENESQNSALHRSSSTATSSLVLNPEEDAINDQDVLIPSSGTVKSLIEDVLLLIFDTFSVY